VPRRGERQGAADSAARPYRSCSGLQLHLAMRMFKHWRSGPKLNPLSGGSQDHTKDAAAPLCFDPIISSGRSNGMGQVSLQVVVVMEQAYGGGRKGEMRVQCVDEEHIYARTSRWLCKWITPQAPKRYRTHRIANNGKPPARRAKFRQSCVRSALHVEATHSQRASAIRRPSRQWQHATGK